MPAISGSPTQVSASAATVLELESIESSQFKDGDLAWVEALESTESGGFFRADFGSVATWNGTSVLYMRNSNPAFQAPVGTPGRWVALNDFLNDTVFGLPQLSSVGLANHAEELWPTDVQHQGPPGADTLPRDFTTNIASIDFPPPSPFYDSQSLFISRITSLSKLPRQLGSMRLLDPIAYFTIFGGQVWRRNQTLEVQASISPADPLNLAVTAIQDGVGAYGTVNAIAHCTYFSKNGGQVWDEAKTFQTSTGGPVVPYDNGDVPIHGLSDMRFDSDGNAHDVGTSLIFSLPGSGSAPTNLVRNILQHSKSTDEGLSWTKVAAIFQGNPPDTQENVSAPTVWPDTDPARKNNVYVAFANLLEKSGEPIYICIARSRDGGNNWDRFPNWLPRSDESLNPADPNYTPFLPYFRVYQVPPGGWVPVFYPTMVFLKSGDITLIHTVVHTIPPHLPSQPPTSRTQYTMTFRIAASKIDNPWTTNAPGPGITWVPSYPQASAWPPPDDQSLNAPGLGKNTAQFAYDPQFPSLALNMPLGLKAAYDPDVGGPDGTIYISLGDVRFTVGQATGGLILSKSIDGGANWSTPIPANTLVGGFQVAEPWSGNLAVIKAIPPAVPGANEGYVGVFYEDTRNHISNVNSEMEADMWLTVFSPGLAGIVKEMRVTPFSYDLRQASIFNFFNNNIYYRGAALPLLSDGTDFIGIFVATNPPYGLPPDDAPGFRVDERRRQDVVCARIQGPFP